LFVKIFKTKENNFSKLNQKFIKENILIYFKLVNSEEEIVIENQSPTLKSNRKDKLIEIQLPTIQSNNENKTIQKISENKTIKNKTPTIQRKSERIKNNKIITTFVASPIKSNKEKKRTRTPIVAQPAKRKKSEKNEKKSKF
jgi:hypothetical protein